MLHLRGLLGYWMEGCPLFSAAASSETILNTSVRLLTVVIRVPIIRKKLQDVVEMSACLAVVINGVHEASFNMVHTTYSY